EAVLIDCFDELLFAARPDGYGLNHGHTQRLLECLAVQPVASPLRQVAHVQRHQHWTTNTLQIQYEAQIETEIGCVDHANHEVWRRLGCMPTEHDVAGDRLIQGGRLQAISTGEVDQAENPTRLGAGETTFLTLYGDARVVGDFLAASGQ